MKNIKYILGFVIAVALVIAGVSLFRNPEGVVGSVMEGQGYYATTTSTGTIAATSLLRTGPGIFGSVVITGAATGVMTIYDATTTNISARTGQTATSTITLASFPASTAAGTYTFDRVFNNGLIIDIIGTTPTTTVTFK